MTNSFQDKQARFLRRYRNQKRGFAAFDRALSLLTGKQAPANTDTPPMPRRLLVANYGHLGDVLITMSLLPAIREAIPGVHIGLLTGSWNKSLVAGSPFIDQVHYLDHWFQIRSEASRASKVRAYLRQLPALLSELKAARYDTGVDVRLWFPNSLPVLYMAGIPVRIGFSRVGFEPLLTHSVLFEYDRTHERDHQSRPLRRLPIDGSLFDRPPAQWLWAKEPGLDVLRRHCSGPVERYAVLHPGASTEVRNWTEAGWRALVRQVISSGARPVLTGLGPEQHAVIERVIAGSPEAINLANKVSWSELVSVVSGAQLVYSVETSVGHLAGALGVPTVAIYGGMQDPSQWAPSGRKVAVVTHELPCNPCFHKNGCEHMSCLRSIQPQDVWGAGSQLLTPP